MGSTFLVLCTITVIQFAVSQSLFLPESRLDQGTDFDFCTCCTEKRNQECCALCDVSSLSAVSVDGDHGLETARARVLEKLRAKYKFLQPLLSVDAAVDAKRQRGRKGTYDERFYKFQVGGKRRPFLANDGSLDSSKRSDNFFHGATFGKRGSEKRSDPFFHGAGFGKRSVNHLNPWSQNGELLIPVDQHGNSKWEKRGDKFFQSAFFGKRGRMFGKQNGLVGVADNTPFAEAVNTDEQDSEKMTNSNDNVEHTDKTNSFKSNGFLKRELNSDVPNFIVKPGRTIPFIYDSHEFRKRSPLNRIYKMFPNTRVPYLELDSRVKK